MFGIDIDRTIGIDKVAIATYMARELGLDIPVETLAGLLDYWAFTRLPEVVAHLAMEEHKVTYEAAFQCAKNDLEVTAGLHPIPGAAEGIVRLLEHGHAAYYTSRTEESLETTATWLQAQNMPMLPIHSCHNFYIKYLKTFKHTMHSNEQVVLIDDNAEKIVKAWPRTVEKWPVIGKQYPKRFTLVAFGHAQETTFSHDVPFPVVPLPRWKPEHIQQLLDQVLVSTPEEKLTHGSHHNPCTRYRDTFGQRSKYRYCYQAAPDRGKAALE